MLKCWCAPTTRRIMVMLGFILLGAIASFPVVTAAKVPHFLLIGQSNMEGVVTNSEFQPRFNQTMDFLFSSDDEGGVFEVLLPWLTASDSRPPTPNSTYEFEASELLRIKREGFLTNNIRKPLSTVDCSFTELKGGDEEAVDYRIPSSPQPKLKAVDQDLSPYAQCGKVFGPELMMGHTMADCYGDDELISLVKFASGGTEIYRHWSKESGFFWDELVQQVQNINPTQDEWQAIVWFQGENDAFDEPNANGYLGNLTVFIANLRQEMYDVDVSSFDQPADIPVIIVGMGCWITKSGISQGPKIYQAQKDFTNNDVNSVLVPTDDLSCHFHFDDASQLIIGYRIAEALKPLVPVPSPSPSETPSLPLPSADPSVTPSRTPSTSPSLRPSLQKSNQPSNNPSLGPSVKPSVLPSYQPSSNPSLKQSVVRPSALPSYEPSFSPSLRQSAKPSILPSYQPSSSPSLEPSEHPSVLPSYHPSASHSLTPSVNPSMLQSSGPSLDQTAKPSVLLSSSPSLKQSTKPSMLLSYQPSSSPSLKSSEMPSALPSYPPSVGTEAPSAKPISSGESSSSPIGNKQAFDFEKCVRIPEEEEICGNTQEGGAKPRCTPYRSPEHCPADESFSLLIKDRETHVKQNLKLLEGEDYWFQFLDDRGAAYAFTRSKGIPTPTIHCCIDDLDQLGACFDTTTSASSPTSKKFVIHASGLHSNVGTFVFPDGFSGLELISGLQMSLEDVIESLKTNSKAATKYIVEEFVSASTSVPKLPQEYKLHFFNGKFGSATVMLNRGSDCQCYLEVDEDWARLDRWGCFLPTMPMGRNKDGDSCYDIDFRAGSMNPYQFKGFDTCGEVAPLDNCVWETLLEYGRQLSESIGVYMRIDMFVTDDNRIYVQEYSRSHNGGLRHCAAKLSDDGCVDSCFLGRDWKNAGGDALYGGPKLVRPVFLADYHSKTAEDQCFVVTEASISDTSSQQCVK